MLECLSGWVEFVDDFLAFLFGEEGRAFGDDDDVGVTAAAAELAEVAKGEDVVVDIEVAVLGEEDGEAGLHTAMLVAVVEENDTVEC